MSDVTMYHNPRCSKSRAALELLRGHGVEPEVIEYLKDPPSVETLRDLIGRLGAGPRDIIRTSEAAFEEEHLADPELDDDRLLAAMHRSPVLIERPIVVRGPRAVLARPPERVLEILEEPQSP